MKLQSKSDKKTGPSDGHFSWKSNQLQRKCLPLFVLWEKWNIQSNLNFPFFPTIYFYFSSSNRSRIKRAIAYVNVWNAALFGWSLSISLSIKKRIPKKVFMYGMLYALLIWLNKLSYIWIELFFNQFWPKYWTKSKKNTYASSIRRLRLSIFAIHLQVMSTSLNSICIQKS